MKSGQQQQQQQHYQDLETTSSSYATRRLKTCTLVSRIIVQVGIKVQVGKISKINKSAGWNKAMQVGILGILLL